MAALICGHRVKSVNIEEESGNVKLTGVNTFVLLAPYIFPLFAIGAVAAYVILSFFVRSLDGRIFLALFGFFTALHLIHTYKALTETEQTDVRQAGGSVFSFSLIVLLNAVIIVLLLEFFFPGVIPILVVAKDVITNTVVFWENFFICIYKFTVWAATR
jgi:nitrate reductase NapE component